MKRAVSLKSARLGHRRGAGWAAAFLLVTLAILSPGVVPGRVQAFEAIDGRFEAHGYFEMQLRTISRNYSGQWDLTQWYNVFNLELELDLVQDTHGILDLLEAYVRIEARYDCVYTRGCGMLSGADVYGNDARNLPARLNSGNDYTHAGTILISDDGPLTDPQRNPYTIKTVPGFRGIYDSTPEGLGQLNYKSLMRCGAPDGTGADAYCAETNVDYLGGRIGARFWDADRNRRREGTEGSPGSQPAIDDGTAGAPYLIAMEPFADFRFASIPLIGGSGNGFPLLLMGPWLPKNYVETNATLAGLPNPLDESRVSPQSLGGGFGANPMRSIPILIEDNPGQRQIYILQETELADGTLVDQGRWETINPVTGRFGNAREWNDRPAEDYEARGLFVPSAPLRAALANGGFGDYPFNISEMDRAFNRGASQQDEGELKEAYLDIEMFDSRLWLRVGKQSIVWGKTELFRTTDQFNPQDLALSTLPNLEESRIALWSMRGVWSFYEVGPLSDVRLELAVNFDDFESADLGACGEPYAVNLVCALTFGSWAHGVTGVGVAGVDQPPNPWDNADGLEFGARLEWRWDRFSFAITDFYGYDDFPYTVRLSTYNRNVDWESGRPRHYLQTPQQLADIDRYPCASPGGSGVAFADNPASPGSPNFTEYPTGAAARVTYSGDQEGGCLTPGPTNNNFRVLSQLGAGEGGEDPEWGVPLRVDPELRKSNVYTPLTNSYHNQAGRWLNDAAYGDANDPRREYSRANSAAPTSFTEWKEGPQAGYCDTDPRLANHDFCNNANAGSRGRRIFDPEKYIEVDVGGTDEWVPNPRFNPYYDPRFDRHFDVGAYASTVPEQFDLQANPGNVIAAPGPPVLFDPFLAVSDDGPGGSAPDKFAWWWSNAFDPNLEEFDPRNALDNSPVNNSLFNFICAVTVGFSSLDASACALTVFSSSKQPSGADSGNPRISTLIGSFMAGSGGFNGFLGTAASDKILSKGPRLPNGMGMPLVSLHADLGAADLGLNNDGSPGDSLCSQIFGCGKDAFRTTDVRRHWADMASGTLPGTEDDTYPWIYARESESYNCLGASPILNAFGGLHLCGGLEIGDTTTPNSPHKLRSAYNVGFFLGRGLTPEQEAVLGCGPYFGTSCDANGADLMWAEASAIVQSFIGADSLGISFADLGISHLVSDSLGSHLMDNGSGSVEYRTDSRVPDRNYELLRINPGALQEVPTAFAPWSDDPRGRSIGLGSNGYLVEGNPNLYNPMLVPSAPCDLSAERLLSVDGTFRPSQERASSRCWDLRQYYQAYAIQPGTAAFDVLGIGGPRCTTADIGGPLSPVAGVLPGCRSKWATIQYQPLDTWDGISSLRPNNPDAGYLGNNWYGQVMSYRAAAFDPADSDRLNPRTDYRQWSSDPSQSVPGQTALANVVPCGTGTPGNPGDSQNPENYDCYLRNPTDWGLPGLGTGATVRLNSAWGTADPRYAAAQASIRSGLNWGVFAGGIADGPCDPSLYANPRQMRDDPSCYLGGWQQTVDGDPDRLGMEILGTNLKYPELVQALGRGAGNPLEALFLYGERVEGGCTPGSSWIYIQRTDDNELLSPSECARIYSNPSETVEGLPWSNALKGGAGHPFTGESFSNELAGVSFNLLMLLVSFSAEFGDGMASVRGFANPEIYDSRYIYDEEWMWNPECRETGYAGVVKTAEECGGRTFVQPQFSPGNCYAPCSAYGDPNRDPATLAAGGRVRMVSGWRSMGITNMARVSDRADHIPNPLPEGVENKLQRDPSLPHILTMFPDLLMRECTSARENPDSTLTARELYDECGSVANGRSADWTINPATSKPWQELRLGDIATGTPHGGLLESLQWDYAFTGSENELMAMLPYCEDLEYTQRHIYRVSGDSSGGNIIPADRFGPNRIDCSRGLEGETLGNERCTYITPQYCGIVQALSGIAGQKRNIVRAGGNSNFGRRTMQWQSGSEIYLAYNRRNVLGFSTDFAEDYTKSNWSMEFTWIEGIPFTDSNSYDLVTEADDFNLTVSVDRPTFINFLNANRTFFINSQWFFQYRKGYKDSFNAIGPWNVLATFAVFTGYFQDRLNPSLVFVWDFRSSSGGFLPQVNYRFSEKFSMTVGASVFIGSQGLVNMGVNTIGPASPRSGPNAYMNASEPGISIVRDRDEVFMTLRYTF